VTSQPKLFDVSLPIRPRMIEWPGEAVVDIQPLARTPLDDANVTRLTLSTHTGTHVDPPRHFVHGGPTMDDVPLDRWVGPCFVADLRAAGADIEPADLEAAGIPRGTTRLILRTTNSELWGSAPHTLVESFISLTPDAARWVVARGIRLVGIDYMSVGPFDARGVDTHNVLLGNDVICIEGLDLRAIEPGHYELLCFPLKIEHGDGAPARVALRGPL
jgi:arylformamidase